MYYCIYEVWYLYWATAKIEAKLSRAYLVGIRRPESQHQISFALEDILSRYF